MNRDEYRRVRHEARYAKHSLHLAYESNGRFHDRYLADGRTCFQAIAESAQLAPLRVPGGLPAPTIDPLIRLKSARYSRRHDQSAYHRIRSLAFGASPMKSWFKKMIRPEHKPEPCLPHMRSMVASINGQWLPYSPDYWRRGGFGMELADALYVVGRKLADELNATPRCEYVHCLAPAVRPPTEYTGRP